MPAKKKLLIVAKPDVVDFETSINLVDQFDCSYSFATDLDSINPNQVDLVLIDLLHFPSDKIEHFLKNNPHATTPIVLLSWEKTDSTVINHFFKSGIQDVIFPPIFPLKLGKRLQGILALHQLNAENSTQSQLFENDKLVATNIFNRIISDDLFETSAIQTNYSQQSLCKGDLLLIGRTPDNHLHILFGDFSGQGLASLMVASPVAEIFYGMSKKGFSVSDIAEEINRKLYRFLPVELFLAASLISLNPSSQSLKVINCGMPRHYLVNPTIASLNEIVSSNSPLGIQSEFEPDIQSFDINPDHYLYLFSDKLFEFNNQRKTHATLLSNAQGNINWLKQALIDANLLAKNHDNAVFASLHCDIQTIPWQHKTTAEPNNHVLALPWKTMMEFDIEALRAINPVPVIMNTLMDIQGLTKHQQSIFMILTELFANALDHGILGLDSAIKSSPDGFMEFYELKEKRLQSLESGRIRILLSHIATETGGQLTIKVIDSGQGFDYKKSRIQMDENTAFSGRGITLLQSLCSQLNYQGQGNRVTAVFDWDNDTAEN